MENNNSPKCPYCETEFEDEDIWYSEKHGKVYTGECDESELICVNDDCKKVYHVRCDYIRVFVNVDSDGEELLNPPSEEKEESQ